MLLLLLLVDRPDPRCSSFGHKILTLKPLVKLIPGIMEHKDKSVREEAKAMIVELHRWIGAAIKTQIASLKPVQVSVYRRVLAGWGGAGRAPAIARCVTV